MADQINAQVDKAALAVRETLAHAQWLPEYARPAPPRREIPIEVVALSRYEQVRDWVSRHKVLTGAAIAVFGIVLYRSYRSSRLRRKTRRAKRARNGGRLEVVVIAGSPTLPLTRSLALDMERRGFIVFVVCNAAEDESLVHSMARSDIRPLPIDVTDVSPGPFSLGPPFSYFPLLLFSPLSTSLRRDINSD